MFGMSWVKRTPQLLDKDLNGFVDGPGTFHNVWIPTDLPDPGAQGDLAYASLALAPRGFIARGVPVSRMLKAFISGQQLGTQQAVAISGLPIVSGTIYGTPLFDPNATPGP